MNYVNILADLRHFGKILIGCIMSKKSYYELDSQESILRHARRLENSTVAKALASYPDGFDSEEPEYFPGRPNKPKKTFRGKGRFGQFLEETYFELTVNSYSRPDFEEANLELKVAPLKRLKTTDELRAKERIVLGIIDYFGIIEEDFETSHFLYKNSELLLVFYIHNNLLKLEDLQIDLVDIWRCIQEDRQQIKRDWETIAEKVRAGEADTISEGDTLLLGAATKGSTMEKSLIDQPNSPIKARQRAFCFKIRYVNYIYDTLLERKAKKTRKQVGIRLIPKGEDLSLDEAIYRKLSPYYGVSAPDIAKANGWNYNPKHKSRYARLTELLLGLDRKNKSIHEFEASGIEMKTIRVLANGKIPEAMSFKAIDYCEIIEEEWEDSDFYQSLISKFLFVIYKENDAGEFNLFSFKLWNMPNEDLELAEEVWLDTKNKIKKGDYGSFAKMKKPKGQRGIAHVRPKGIKGQTVPTPQGTQEGPKCFWLDRDYVTGIIEKLI